VFSITELVCTCLIIPLCDLSHTPKPRRCLAVLTLSIFHILAATYDQFAANVLLGEGAWHQRSRDLGFMAADWLHVVIATSWLRGCWSRSDIERDELLLCVVCVLLLCVLALAT